MSIKDKLKSKAHSIAQAVEAKKEILIAKVAESNAWIVVGKWALTHWVTVLLTVMVLGMYGKMKYDNYVLEDALIKQELQNLNISLEDLRKQRDELLKKVTQFNNRVEAAKKETDKVRKAAAVLTPEQKKTKILDYKTRLIKNRGIK